MTTENDPLIDAAMQTLQSLAPDTVPALAELQAFVALEPTAEAPRAKLLAAIARKFLERGIDFAEWMSEYEEGQRFYAAREAAAATERLCHLCMGANPDKSVQEVLAMLDTVQDPKALINGKVWPLNFSSRLDEDNRTPLLHAVWLNAAPVAELLLRWGADPNQKTPDGHTALEYAVLGFNLEIANLLLAHGADINNPFYDGSNAVIEAVLHANMDMLELLLTPSLGADVNKPTDDADACAPLHWAVSSASAPAMRLLLAAPDIDVSACTGLRQDAFAVLCCTLWENASCTQLEAAQMLAVAGAKVDTKDLHMLSSIDYAVHYNLDDIAALILAIDRGSLTPAQIAAKLGQCNAAAVRALGIDASQGQRTFADHYAEDPTPAFPATTKNRAAAARFWNAAGLGWSPHTNAVYSKASQRRARTLIRFFRYWAPTGGPALPLELANLAVGWVFQLEKVFPEPIGH